MHQAALAGAVLFYLAAVLALYRSLLNDRDGRSAPGRGVAIMLILAGAGLHVLAQGSHWFADGGAQISILNILSLCSLVAVLILVSSLLTRTPLIDAGLVVLPLTAVVLVVEGAFEAPTNLFDGTSPALSLHVVSSVMAFGLLGLAGVYALFVSLIDYFLRHHHLNRLVRALPPLKTLESLLFRLIAVGFAVLTVSLGTGLVFVDDLLAQHLAHKTVLACAAWLIFGLLLVGRVAWGWRGRTAVRLTIAGVIVLVLAYFGSKLVLEVLLGEHWNA